MLRFGTGWGAHRLEALVWWARVPLAPTGRATWRGGFACAGVGRGGERFTTGLGDWWVARLNGVKWTPGPKGFYHVIGGGAVVDLKKFDPAKAKWVAPASVRQPIPLHECGGINSGWQLQPAALPEQRHDWWRGGRVRAVRACRSAADKVRFETEGVAPEWDRLLQRGEPLRLPAGYSATLLIDTDDYRCGYPMLEVSGGTGHACAGNGSKRFMRPATRPGRRVRGRRWRENISMGSVMSGSRPVRAAG